MTSTPCWLAVRSTLMTRTWVAAPRQVRFPPRTFRFTTAGRIAYSPRQFVASMSVWARKVNSAPFSLPRCLTSLRFSS